MRLSKAKKGAKPGKDQSIRACPYCGQDILISQGDAKGKAAKLDSFWLGVALMAVVIVVMLALMAGGAA